MKPSKSSPLLASVYFDLKNCYCRKPFFWYEAFHEINVPVLNWCVTKCMHRHLIVIHTMYTKHTYKTIKTYDDTIYIFSPSLSAGSDWANSNGSNYLSLNTTTCMSGRIQDWVKFVCKYRRAKITQGKNNSV